MTEIIEKWKIKIINLKVFNFYFDNAEHLQYNFCESTKFRFHKYLKEVFNLTNLNFIVENYRNNKKYN